HHAFAFVGILIGGVFSDRMALRSKNNRLVIQSFAMLFGAPFIYLMASSYSLTLTYVSLACFGFFRGLYEANFIATLYDVIPPRFHASVIGVLYLFIFTVGSLSPLILGYFKSSVGLSAGLSFMSIAYVIGSIFIFLTLIFFMIRDRAKVALSQHI